MTEQQNTNAPGEEAREAVEEHPENVRERIRETFVRSVRERHIDADEIRKVARQVMDGAVDGVKSAAPSDPESVMRKVIDGLADGFTSAANATRLALEEARGRGEQFAKEDIDQAVQNLRTMQDLFIDTIRDTTSRATHETAEQLKDLNEHAQRAASHLRPVVQDAIEAALRHPVKFTSEAATTSVKGASRAAGQLFHAVSGLLAGAGDLLAGESRRKDESESISPENGKGQ